MRACLNMLAALVFVTGCARGGSVVVDAIQGDRVVISGEHVAVRELGARLRADGFGTGAVVHTSGRMPPNISQFESGAIFLNIGRDATHALVRKVMDELELAGVGIWPDHSTVIQSPAQPEN